MEVTPTEAEQREYCNLGYAKGCEKMPEERSADCVRFALAKDEGTKIILQFVYERGHEPIKHGVVEYDCVAHVWPVPLSDAIVQQQAQCYLAAYLERRPRAKAAVKS